jgi:ribosomal protein S18 acetylase RimI-like enzyme
MSEQSTPAIVVEEATAFTPELDEAMARLMPQLSSSASYDSDLIARAVASPEVHLYLIRLDGAVVGSASLVAVPIPTGLRGHVEDVVVDDAARGHGLSRILLGHLKDEAARLGCRTVDLTSRPSRTAAIHLYTTSGFEQRETNVYRWIPEV